MEFSQTELKTISELGKGNTAIAGLAKALQISKSQAYRVIRKLAEKGILTLSRRTLLLEQKTHVNLLLKLLAKAANLSEPLSGTGLCVYTALLQPKKLSELIRETGLHKTTILKKIRQGKKMSLLLTENKRYRINEKIWPDAKETLEEIKKYEQSIDARIPVNSTIYHKNSKELVFSNKQEQNAEKTAFSAYEKYGIKLLLTTNYYCLPKRMLTLKQVFQHSLFVAEKEPDTRHLLFVSLFYLKHKKELSAIKHPILENIGKVLSGQKVTGYPTLAEIKDKMGVYSIK